MLKDLTVIELSSVLAGPDVGMFFAELGARVIKIENKTTNGDVTRTWKSSLENNNSTISAYYASVNWNKKSLFLDLNNKQDRTKVYELVKDADIVISNYKKGDDLKLKVDYKTLKKINPTIIYGIITGFGSSDKRVAFDVVLQAESGFMSMNGTPESGPIKLPVAIIDVIAAHQLKEGILLALLKRSNENKSYLVEVSLYDAAISALKNQACNWLMNNNIPLLSGSLHPNIAPYGEIFTTKDNKQIVLAIGSDTQFNHFLEIIGALEMLKNKLYSTNPLRVKNRTQLFSDLAPYFKKFNRTKLMKLFINNNVPAGAIKNLKEVFDDKSAQNLINEEIIEGNLSKRVKTAIFKIS
ncbi:MAG: CoA transferase [Bacteroidetes bacterium]|nr:CoA transferase [Bacteroidota bacterium]